MGGYNKSRFKDVLLHVEIYEYLQRQKRPGESFNDVLRRLLLKKSSNDEVKPKVDEIKPKVEVDEIKPIIDDDEVEVKVDDAREEDITLTS